MTQACADLFERSNSGRDQIVAKNGHSVAKSDQVVDFDERARQICKKLWPGRGCATGLAYYAKIDPRQAQRIMAREQGFSLTVFRRLANGPHGRDFHHLFMSECGEDWYRELFEQLQIAELERQRKAIEREIKKRRGEG